MFAVPGWSLSSDLLKTQTGSSKREKKKSKKRQSETGDAESTSSNPAKKPRLAANPEPAQHPSRRPKDEGKFGRKGKPLGAKDRPINGGNSKDSRAKMSEDVPQGQSKPSLVSENSTELQSKDVGKGGQAKQARKIRKDMQAREQPTVQSSPPQLPASAQMQQSSEISEPAPTVKLTPLQRAMKEKLMGSRFRHLNESLYLKTSSESQQIFKDNPDFFHEYHAGFRHQVSSWPQNPVDSLFAELDRRSRIPFTHKKSTGANDTPVGKVESVPSGQRPLPRGQGVCRVADLGCGDASLAEKAKTLPKGTKVLVDSYDLQSSNPQVIKADIANLPAKADSVNVAVLCLALMGTNWVEFIEEAFRILHWKGELWVAEIKSRFSRTQRRPPDHSVGKKRKPDKQQLKRQRQQDEQAEVEKTINEMDGASQSSNTTDVSAFVSVLRKRGFELVDDKSVDLSNKMFVTMRFVKCRPPIMGKYTGQGATKKKSWDAMLREGVDDEQDEQSVLQPCLYKVR